MNRKWINQKLSNTLDCQNSYIEEIREEMPLEKGELKPCPFCGSVARLTFSLEEAFFVECLNRKCFMFFGPAGEYMQKQYAIEGWNKRVVSFDTIDD